jgi:hypothetical protein
VQSLLVNPTLLKSVKWTSTVLTCVAIGVVTAKLVLAGNERSLSGPWEIMFWLGTLALIIHSIEGIVAAIFASRQGNSAIKAWVYTLFTGTVGLMETIAFPLDRK